MTALLVIFFDRVITVFMVVSVTSVAAFAAPSELDSIVLGDDRLVCGIMVMFFALRVLDEEACVFVFVVAVTSLVVLRLRVRAIEVRAGGLFVVICFIAMSLPPVRPTLVIHPPMLPLTILALLVILLPSPPPSPLFATLFE